MINTREEKKTMLLPVLRNKNTNKKQLKSVSTSIRDMRSIQF